MGRPSQHPFISDQDDLAAPRWLGALREAGREAYEATGLPTLRDERWKYTDLRKLAKTPFRPVDDSSPDVGALPRIFPGSHLVVLVNGRMRADLSHIGDLPAGVALGSLSGLMATDPARLEARVGRIAQLAGRPLLALNTAFIRDGVVLDVPAGVKLDRPVEVVIVGEAKDPLIFHPRNLYSVGDGAEAVVIEHHIGAGPYFCNAATEISVGRGGLLRHTRLQEDGPEASHITTLTAEVGDGGHYDNFCFTTGAALSRNEVRIAMAGADAQARIDGCYLIRGQQHCDTSSLIEHQAPRGKSDQTYKGVLDDGARGVFQGKIHVFRDAQKTDGYQMNSALMLSEGCEIDAKPELEIYADDVKCSHGATAGRIDEGPLFYLRARGIPLAEARRMLILAYLGAALEHVALDEVRDHLLARAGAWLEKAGA